MTREEPGESTGLKPLTVSPRPCAVTQLHGGVSDAIVYQPHYFFTMPSYRCEIT